jgi:hypothetical protein
MPLYDCGRPDCLTCQTAFTRKPRYANVSCSQCGGDFGPGDHGYSHCADHRLRTVVREALRKPSSKPCACFSGSAAASRHCHGVCEDAVDRVCAALSLAKDGTK